jgi:amidophosphoribosyltransferase
MDLITRRVIKKLEGDNVSDEILKKYADPETVEYANMVEEIRKELNFTSLQYCRLDDMLEATGIDKNKLCTYCWDGRE